MPVWLLKLRSILGKITDALVAGRAAGLWTRKDGPQPPKAPGL